MYKHRKFRDDQDVMDINTLIDETTNLYQKMLDISKKLDVNAPKKDVLSNIDRYCTNIKTMLDKTQKQIEYVRNKKVDLISDSRGVDYNRVAKRIYDAIVDKIFYGDKSVAEDYYLEVRFDSDKEIMTIACELGYDEFQDINEIADRIIQKYDEDAYFELQDSGFAISLIHN